MTFLELAEKVLREQKNALTASEIWSAAVKKGYEKLLNSEGKTPWASLGAQIYVSSRDNPHSPFAQTDTRPKKFYLKSQASEIDLNPTTALEEPPLTYSKKEKYFERDLHPYLVYYAYYHLRCYTKTINHSNSKREFREWLHPDVVGCYFPMDEWKPEVYELNAAIGNFSVRLLSFELKKSLSFANLRESFFQAVSNSSWANESYLVAAEISTEPDFLSELERLSRSFGIGIIKLNIEDPHSSETIMPPDFREVLDWDTINKLTINNDFKEFLSRIKIDITSKKIHKKEYDPVVKLEELKIKTNGYPS